MAHKQRNLTEDLKFALEEEHFWGIEKGVGWDYANYWDDVMLVQFFLNQTIKANLDQDGIYGPKTQKAIRKFQKEHDCLVDGKVDATDGVIWAASNSKGVEKAYTILQLNAYYRNSYRLYYTDLRMDGKLPPELVSVFSSWTNADS
ncbi:MAG TPA: peptidoglycan-binding domain-containing protein [Pyrinomonadaceae bacterium]|nr:peptidoglycan-binding domain-containing protein [Pyrinomonadaceae bacterium]